ncbi:retron system putative HNH endonuclease [Erwinia aphidicola]|uniref:retron system putative HNH endonuclease n=1 Tax=Erwinia aphidicola TaxID=68334 RepID=UPI00209E0847|nr:retron system putative HNH endonuclease [Erwinia aphidicola]MCP2233515.1 uncharacterized protein (TIGR02646 family) [Erwinia aphidicola]
MRYIKKRNGFSTKELRAQCSQGAPITADEARRRWHRFTDSNYRLHIQLITEQFGLCCYSEINLTDFSLHQNLGSHLEHEKPKSSYPASTFDYNNLLLSSLDSEDLTRFPHSNKFAGHHKKNIFNPQLFISPQDPNCRGYFIYSSETGEISPDLSRHVNDQNKARYTITLLNLNAPYLLAERREWLQEIESLIAHYVEDGDVDAIESIAQVELTLTHRSCPFLAVHIDQLRKFHSAVRAIFGQLGERVINQECPNIN